MNKPLPVHYATTRTDWTYTLCGTFAGHVALAASDGRGQVTCPRCRTLLARADAPRKA